VVQWEWEALTLESLISPMLTGLSLRLLEVFALAANLGLLVGYLYGTSPVVTNAADPALSLAELQVRLAPPLLLPSHPPHPSTSRNSHTHLCSPRLFSQVTAFRLMVVSWTMGLLSLRVAEPVSQWFQMVHDVVRDEHYLLGVQLQNHQPPTPVAPAGEAAVQAH
jgi:hypothetical protein